MNRRQFIRGIVAATVGGLAVSATGLGRAAGAAATASRPNVLIIIGDDATFSDLPLYGGTNVKTPHIDGLARQGLTFNNAYLAEAMCQPCRSELYTGLYPMRNGCCWNHSGSRPGTRSLPHYLGDLGYRVGLAGKIHVTPRSCYPFEMVEGAERGCVSQTAKLDPAPIGAFMARDARQPFCLTVALVVPHCPWTVGDASHFKAKQLDLPPYLADTQATREDVTKYLAEIEVLDQQVGILLKTLADAGQADRTLVLFTSEQGSQLPACKWTNYDQGVHTAMVARWPGRITPGRRTDAMIQYADVTPTLIEAAGGDPAKGNFDGTSFLPVLLGTTSEHRRYAYHMHNNVPEGPPYPIRSVRDTRYHYIRNLKPENLYIEKHVMGQFQWHDYWPSWMFASTDSEHTYQMLERYMRRPAEQLFDTQTDPHELKNRADDPALAEVKQRLSAELDRWMKDQGDPGADLDTFAALTARRKEARRKK